MTTRRRLLCGFALIASAAALALPAHADIRVGVVLSTTGPAAAIGIPSKNTVQMWPATVGGQRAQYIVLDDASDPSAAGQYVPYRFLNGESGLFGEETHGEWLTIDQALAAFRRLIRRKWIQVLLYRRQRIYLYYNAMIYRLSGRYPNLGWYDIHARHSTVE